MSTRLSTEELDNERIEAASRVIGRSTYLQMFGEERVPDEPDEEDIECAKAALAAADAISEPAARRALRDLTAALDEAVGTGSDYRWALAAARAVLSENPKEGE